MIKVYASNLPDEIEDGEYYGSNSELEWDLEQVVKELSLRAYLQDAAFDEYQSAARLIAARRRDLRLRYGPAFVKYAKDLPITVAKAQAEHECRRELHLLEEAQARERAALERLRSLQSQLSAAQTRAKLWEAQWRVERYGPT